MRDGGREGSWRKEGEGVTAQEEKREEEEERQGEVRETGRRERGRVGR